MSGVVSAGQARGIPQPQSSRALHAGRQQTGGVARVVRISATVSDPEAAAALLASLGAGASTEEPVALELVLRFERAAGAGTPGLAVDARGRFYDPPHGPRVDLRRSPVLRALLGALVRARIDRPGEPCSRDALVSACWPGARIAPRSAGNRLRVAIAMLRRRGLRPVLRRDAGGWWLATTVTCVLVQH